MVGVTWWSLKLMTIRNRFVSRFGGFVGVSDLVMPAQNFCVNDLRQTVEKRSKQVRKAISTMISVQQPNSMFYDRVDVKVKDLEPKKSYIIRNKFKDVSGRFESWAKFEADHEGRIFCGHNPSVDGTYQDASIRCPGVIDMFGTGGGSIEHRASLLASKGFTVLSLAYLRYQDLPKDLSNGLHMEYFEEAVDWFTEYPQVQPGAGIAVIGVSSGADLAVIMGSKMKKVVASVGINGFYGRYDDPEIRYHGKPVMPTEPLSLVNAVADYKSSLTKKLLKSGRLLNADSSNHQTIPRGEFLLESSRTPFKLAHCSKQWPVTTENVFQLDKGCVEPVRFLLVTAGGDMNVDSRFSCLLYERLVQAGKQDLAELVTYPGAGHLIEPPWQPFQYMSYHRIWDCCAAWGGSGADHSHAQVMFWDKLLQFLSDNVGTPVQLPEPDFSNSDSTHFQSNL